LEGRIESLQYSVGNSPSYPIDDTVPVTLNVITGDKVPIIIGFQVPLLEADSKFPVSDWKFGEGLSTNPGDD